MRDDGRNLHKTLAYSSANVLAGLLPTGLLLILIGLAILILVDTSSKQAQWDDRIVIILCLFTGVAVVVFALWTRTRTAKPLFTLSPAGITYRIPWVRQVLVPWSEIEAVNSIDIVTKLWSPAWLFLSFPHRMYMITVHLDVTVVLVSRPFYDKHIFVDSYFRRGPGWVATFIPNGEQVQIALHHDLVSVERSVLRQAVKSRWLAFRDQTAEAQAAENAAASPGARPDVVAMGHGPRRLSRFQVVQIAVLLAGIAGALANVAGLWQLEGQGEARQARARDAEEHRYWEDAQRKMREEATRREAADKERQRETDETMRRAFGR